MGIFAFPTQRERRRKDSLCKFVYEVWNFVQIFVLSMNLFANHMLWMRCVTSLSLNVKIHKTTKWSNGSWQIEIIEMRSLLSEQICSGQMIHALIISLYFELQSSPLECESLDTMSHVAYVGDVKLNLARSLLWAKDLWSKEKNCTHSTSLLFQVWIFCFELNLAHSQ